LLPYNDASLVNQSNVELSPYTLVFKEYLTYHAATFINLIILIAVLSAGNASMYSATRILWYLGKTNQAPKVFQNVNRYGVPMLALICTAFIGSLVFLSSYIGGNGVLFSYLVQISSLSGFIAWFGIAYSHFEFRRKYLPAHGGLSSLTYKAKFYPIAQIVSMIFLVLIVAAQFITLDSEQRTFFQVLAVYSSVILFGLFYLGHKVFSRSH
jgi:lysine-specific permease